MIRILRRAIPAVVLVLLIAATAWVSLNRELVRDQLTLQSYDPPLSVAAFATDTSMTPYATRLFYVNKPTLDDKIALNDHCKNLGEEAAVLGCFKGNRLGIHIFHVTDTRLKGIEQVTAAHEMLHQAYERLSAGERAHINSLLEDFAATSVHDQSLLDKLDIYRKTEPNDIDNEMHSLFGTEVANLTPELETYYQRYFADRHKVVAYHQQSRAAFDEYRRELDQMDKQLDALKIKIDAGELSLNSQYAALTAAKKKLDSDLAANRIDEYNAGVTPYNNLVNEYNATLARTNSIIEQYNQLVRKRNEVAVQVTSLNEAINSRLPKQ